VFLREKNRVGREGIFVILSDFFYKHYVEKQIRLQQSLSENGNKN